MYLYKSIKINVLFYLFIIIIFFNANDHSVVVTVLGLFSVIKVFCLLLLQQVSKRTVSWTHLIFASWVQVSVHQLKAGRG